jgi:CRISPR-associated protein Csm3
LVELQGVVKIGFIMQCETGLRIGGVARGGEIGGVENIIVRDPFTQEPYVPGSSLKGAMRSRYELYKGLVGDKIHLCKNLNCEICTVFGRTPEALKGKEGEAEATSTDVINLTRLRVRDAFATDDTRRKWNIYGNVEVKGENAIDRLTSQANPRQVERIPKGSEFDCGMSFFIFDGSKDVERLGVIFTALKLVEEDYLGGYGSRGYGRVSFRDFRLTILNRNYFIEPIEKNMKSLGLRGNLEKLFVELHDVEKDVKEFLGLV